MKIERNTPVEAINLYQLADKLKPRQAGESQALPAGDTLNLSPEARALRELAAKTASLPEGREELVAEVAARIAQGTYRIDAAAVAGKLLAAIKGEYL